MPLITTGVQSDNYQRVNTILVKCFEMKHRKFKFSLHIDHRKTKRKHLQEMERYKTLFN